MRLLSALAVALTALPALADVAPGPSCSCAGADVVPLALAALALLALRRR